MVKFDVKFDDLDAVLDNVIIRKSMLEREFKLTHSSESARIITELEQIITDLSKLLEYI